MHSLLVSISRKSFEQFPSFEFSKMFLFRSVSNEKPASIEFSLLFIKCNCKTFARIQMVLFSWINFVAIFIIFVSPAHFEFHTVIIMRTFVTYDSLSHCTDNHIPRTVVPFRYPSNFRYSIASTLSVAGKKDIAVLSNFFLSNPCIRAYRQLRFENDCYVNLRHVPHFLRDYATAVVKLLRCKLYRQTANDKFLRKLISPFVAFYVKISSKITLVYRGIHSRSITFISYIVPVLEFYETINFKGIFQRIYADGKKNSVGIFVLSNLQRPE